MPEYGRLATIASVSTGRHAVQTPAIEVEHVSFSYEHGRVLDDISFRVQPGEFIGIVGPNGSGKSTLMRLMLGLLTPQQGTIRLLGEEIRHFKHWHYIGYISQRAASQAAGFPATVEEIVGLNLYAQSGPLPYHNRRQRQMIEQALRSVDMLPYKNRLISQLSGGQQQRALIARALVCHPKILFLDEPLTGIDKKSEDTLYALLDRFHTQMGITLVMVAHDIPTLSAHATRLIQLA